jgi:hypothetical protein
MRVFLRNKQTRLYCADVNEWAAAVGHALEFTSVPHAARFARDENLPGIEIVVRCDLLAEEVAMPVLPEWCDVDQPRSAVV